MIIPGALSCGRLRFRPAARAAGRSTKLSRSGSTSNCLRSASTWRVNVVSPNFMRIFSAPNVSSANTSTESLN